MKGKLNILEKAFKSSGVISLLIAACLTISPYLPKERKIPHLDYDLRYTGPKLRLGFVKVSKGFKDFPG